MLVETGSMLTIPWLIGMLAGGLISVDEVSISQITFLLFALLTLKAGLQIMRGYVLAQISEKILATTRTETYAHLQYLPMKYFKTHKTGRIMSFVNDDAYILGTFISSTLLHIIPLVLTVIGASVALFIIEPYLALFIVLCLPLYFILMKLLGKKIQSLSRRLQDENAKSVAMLEENFTTIETTKAFSREKETIALFAKQMDEMRIVSAKLMKVKAIIHPLVLWLSTSSILLFIWLNQMVFVAKDITASELVSFLAYAALLAQPMAGLIGSWGHVKSVQGALTRLNNVYSKQTETFDKGLRPDPINGAIEFRNIDYSYPERAALLQGLNLKINAGETIALIGENGSGKSTLIDMLVRFIDPDIGDIFLDDYPISQINLKYLRNQIGLVTQHPLLFDETLLSNITYGCPNASDQEIQNAIRASQLDKFIAKCPMGLSTMIGEKGVFLSGGEKQRLSLSRALLTDPKILVLDETTAMFDPESETSFVHDMKEAVKNRTVIIITHRPESISLADRIFRLENGRIESCQTAKPKPTL